MESCRILVISDSHRNFQVFEKIVKQYGRTCDALVFCGDGIQELVMMMNHEIGCAEDEKFLPPVIAFARGNGDPSTTDTDFKPYSISIPEIQIIKAAHKKIFISHGHLQGVDYSDSLVTHEAGQNGCEIILHGHTHIPRDVQNGKFKIINPGIISRPRGGTPPGFAILTIQKNYVDAAFIKIERDRFETYTPMW